MYIYSIYQELAEMVDCGSVIRKAKKNHKKKTIPKEILNMSQSKKNFFFQKFIDLKWSIHFY